ncbi:MAG: ROK family protein [Proteobacteria bacterium]|nr:ROK family protein [Pseudomonadota bacterium]
MRIGIDLGGTKIEGLLLAPDDSERRRLRVATPRDDYDASLAAVAGLVEALEREAGRPCPVGIGMPGSLSPRDGLVRNSNSTCLNGRPFRQDIEARLGRSVRLANDANCLALSEAADGAGAGAAVVFGAILGTGVGGGLVVDGRLIQGVNLVGGEWGHNPLPGALDEERPGPVCYCGRSGCIEAYLSGPSLARDHFRATGETLDPMAIARRAEQGDGPAEASLRRHEDRLARALGSLINIVDPDVIVLGGGLSNLVRLYANVPRIWQRYIFSDVIFTRLLPAVRGDSSGVRGAARLWPEPPDT